MRADGEITRETFQTKKEEIETQIGKLQKELVDLQPQEKKPTDVSHDEKIKILKFYLEQSVNPDAVENISEDVIKAFVTKVVVREDGFDWYLRFSPDNSPTSLGITGRKKSNATISSLRLPQHRLLSRDRGNNPVMSPYTPFYPDFTQKGQNRLA